MAILHRGLGLDAAPSLGDGVRIDLGTGPAVEGVVDFTSPSIVGVRSDDTLYRFSWIPMGGGIYLGHHAYRDGVDVAAETARWSSWLDAGIAASAGATARPS